MKTLLLSSLALFSAAGSLAQVPDSDWHTFNRTYRGDRFSPLSEITAANVSRLQPVARFETGVETSFQTGPVVVDGTLYCTTYKHTYAIDAATGKLKWKDVADLKKTGLGSHRGVAHLDGKVFRGYSNGWVVAMDAATGKRLWSKRIADAKIGETIPMAPIAWDGKLFIGNAGGDMYGVTGRVYALDAATGDQVWLFRTVPTSGPAAATWKNKSIPPAGACTWTTYSLDPDSGILYVAAGNPAPDFDIALRPGANLYSNCVIALDAKTGRLLAYAQPTKNDTHDWDLSAAPALITTRGGKRLAALGGKDGILYGIDNRGAAGGNGRVLPIRFRTAVTRRFNVMTPLSPNRFTRFAPGSQGGVEWNGPAFDPRNNLIFTPAIDWPTSVKLSPREKTVNRKPGESWSAAHDGGFGKQDEQWGGFLTAVDADTGRVRWRYKASAPVVAGVTPTAGGVVFASGADGYLRAFNSRTGRQLWRHNTGRPVGGGIVSYQVDGRQYIAVPSGMSSPIWRPKPGTTAQIIIYRLP